MNNSFANEYMNSSFLLSSLCKGDVKKETVFLIRDHISWKTAWYSLIDVVVTGTFINTLFYTRSSKFAIKRLDAEFHTGVIWFTERFNIITYMLYVLALRHIHSRVDYIVGTAKLISSLLSVISNRPASLKLAWTALWVERLLDSFRCRIRNIKDVLWRKRSTAERLTLILREILERFQTTDLLHPTVLGPACKVAQDFQSWFSKMQWKRNQMGWSRWTHNVRENTDRGVIQAGNTLAIGTIWAKREHLRRR